MTSEKQIEANRKNAQLSTGANDTSKTRFNAVKYGLTGNCVYSKKDEKIIEEISEELSSDMNPKDVIEKLLIGRLAKLFWRLQRVNQIEEAYFKNSLINQRNHEKSSLSKMFKQDYDEDPEEEIMIENIGENFELINRYETSIENRILKILQFIEQRKSRK